MRLTSWLTDLFSQLVKRQSVVRRRSLTNANVASMIQILESRRSLSAPRRRCSFPATVQILEPRTLLSAAPAEFANPHPVEGDGFGSAVTVLTNGNVVITAPNDDAGGGSAAANTGAGAVYLFNGQTRALISTLTGSHAGDLDGATVTALTNGNFVIDAPDWNNSTGAVTWGNGTNGVSGTMSASNSLVGTIANEAGIGLSGITALNNGNYVVNNPNWDNGLGAVTFGNGTTGVIGVISANNSLVGSHSGDKLGSGAITGSSGGVTALSNGNYVVDSPSWNGGLGATTLGDGNSGVRGTVSTINSLVGSNAGDEVGSGGITVLSNGGYVVDSPNWNGSRGAVTFGGGGGVISASNSLVGSNTGDEVGSDGVTALSNGSYVVDSQIWNGGLGAVTLGSGIDGVIGVISTNNSLIGNHAGDDVGSGGITELSDGNYVVDSSSWNTFDSPYWISVGAVTFRSGTVAVGGVISASNSLVGSNAGDEVGAGGVTALSNGSYVVDSQQWNGGRGAVTLAAGTSSLSGVISANNSLVGSKAGDSVGSGLFGGFGGVTALSNGDYVVDSPSWNGSQGAVTFAKGAFGVTGVISASNSLVGSKSGDQVGSDGVEVLSNGNYVVDSNEWSGGDGAVTFGNGVTGVNGIVSGSNSLVGSNPGDAVGFGGVYGLSNGNYAVDSFDWSSDKGAVTFGNGVTGVSGIVSGSNSLVGSNPGDAVGNGNGAVLSNGNYVVGSPFWNNVGAVTFVSGVTGAVGQLNSGNSVFGQSTNSFSFVIPDNAHGKFYAAFPNDGTGHVYRGSDTTGFVAPTTPTVTVIDVGGPDTGNPQAATASVKGTGGVTVSGTTTLTYYTGSTASGTGTTTAPTNVGTYTVVASFVSSDPNYTNASSVPVTFKITPGAASQVVWTQSATTGTAGTVIATAFKVSIEDKYGNVVTSNTSTVTLSVITGPGSFATGSTLMATAVAGAATFSNLTLDTSGTYTFSAADSNTALTTATSANVVISSAVAATMTVQQSPATATAGVPTTAVKVAVEDHYGNLETTTTAVTLTLASGTFSNGLKTATANTVGGIATFSGLIFDAAGTDTVNVTSGTLPAKSFNVTVSPATASKLVYLQAPPTTGTAGVGVGIVTVQVEDSFGNVVTTNSSTVTLAFGATKFTAAAVKGIATFSASNLVIDTSGSYSVTVSDGTLTSPAARTLAMSAAAASQVVLKTVPTTGTAGTKLTSVVATIEDKYGNVVTSNASKMALSVKSGPGSFATGSTLLTTAVNGVVIFSNLILDTAGVYVLSAAQGSLVSAVSGNITIAPAAASKLVFTKVPSTGTHNVLLSTLTVTIEDAFGNTVTGNTSSVTLAVNSSTPVGGSFAAGSTTTIAAVKGIATFTNLKLSKAGTYQLKATDGTLTAAISGNIVVS